MSALETLARVQVLEARLAIVPAAAEALDAIGVELDEEFRARVQELVSLALDLDLEARAEVRAEGLPDPDSPTTSWGGGGGDGRSLRIHPGEFLTVEDYARRMGHDLRALGVLNIAQACARNSSTG